ncbi:MAG TPA: retropepsin-like aspartic protease [Gammaproteobacteria bacterium]|nr:retropepsin-like aspartic protease [Gammaproteobacteria bacterium]
MKLKLHYIVPFLLIALIGFSEFAWGARQGVSKAKRDPLFLMLTASQVIMPEKVIIDAQRGYFDEFYTIQIYINDHGPYRFILDTGAELNYISQELARELALKEMETKKLRVVTATQKETFITETRHHAKAVKMGQAIFKDVYFNAGTDFEDDASLMKRVGVHGIMGMNTFYHTLLTLDLKREKIILTRGDLLQNKKAGPLKMYRFSPRVPGIIITQEAVPNEFVVDTGFFGKFRINYCGTLDGLSVSKPAVEIQSYDLYDKAEKSYYATLKGKIKIHDLLIENPEIVYTIHSCLPSQKFYRFGLLGVALLRQYQVTFDQKNNKILFVKN